ncbi:MAG: hypothetical protein E7598_04470 [Ruminococcaceae bacterium]|nr:hypothetical protein [Oscillospiraceae bacterium]
MSQNTEIKAHEKQKKHTLRNVILITLAVLVLLAGILAFAFRRYINILVTGVSKSDEQIHSMQAENDKKTYDILNELVVVTMRDLTDEERQMLERGEITPEQAMILIKGGTLEPVETTAIETVTTAPEEITTTEICDTTAEQIVTSPQEVTTSAPKPDVTTEVTTTAQTTTAVVTTEVPKVDEGKLRARIEGIIAEIYLLRAEYLNAIDKTIYEAKLEYMKLPKEKHTLQGKMQFVTNTLVPKGNALEAECDAKIDALLVELKSILNELGESTAIIDEIRKVYAEQKDLKLTELTNQYSSKLK